ncbi:MAG: response regulator [Desulfobacterales bacterium]|nr:response regulator [Desulfobacterales bacterium]
MGKRVVLIVDDDPLILSLLDKEVKRNFFNTCLAHDGQSALEIFKKKSIDIVLIDVNLPDVNGLDLIQTAKTYAPNCEVIVITGYGNVDIATASLRKGAIDYIEKPINLEELKTAFGRALEKLAEKEQLAYKNTILLIDDEELVVNHLAVFLEQEGYNVFKAHSGEQGLEVIENNKIDVVITDIKMKGMSGIEVLQRAKRYYSDIEIIVVTGFKDEELSISALRAGAIDYINKPINLDELLFSISKAIDRINLNRTRLYRYRELKISKDIINKMNEELERRIQARTKELDKVQGQLFHTSKLATLGEMSAGLAHEINQPLGGISLISKTFRKLMQRNQLTNEEIEQGLNDIDSSVKRMDNIIRHIRTFARQDQLRFEKIDIRESIRNAFTLLDEQLRLHDIKVIKDFDENIPLIYGEPFQLEQVWLNIMVNARDAVDDNANRIKKDNLNELEYIKTIKISCRFDQAENNIIVECNDNGIGISTENIVKIFDPFFTTKEVGRATGLGLSISYGIIQNHKGQIKAESIKGIGTTMTIKLPLSGEYDNNIDY